MVLSFVSRSNQDGDSKSNTAPLLAEAMVTERNSKKHSKFKLNKKTGSLNLKCSFTQTEANF